MSSVVISGNTSGTITLDAPAVAGTTTLTLPATSGTVIVNSGAQTIEFADGSAGAPSITNSGDTNTGMFFPAADTIAFAEGGAESMRIDSSGNVGIGNTTPSSFDVTGKPLVVGSGSGNQGITIYAGTTGYSTVNFADGTTGSDRYSGQVSYDHTNNALLFATTTGSERMRIDSSGNLLVGTTSSPSSAYRFYAAAPNGLSNGAYRATSSTGFGVWDIYSDVGGTQVIKYSISANGTAGAVSDKRQKKNIEPSRSYLDDLMKIRVVKYNWITDNDSAPKELGWIAQEVEQVFPGMVSDTTDGNFKILKKEVFIPMLLTAIQELKAELDNVKTELATLKGAPQ